MFVAVLFDNNYCKKCFSWETSKSMFNIIFLVKSNIDPTICLYFYVKYISCKFLLSTVNRPTHLDGYSKTLRCRLNLETMQKVDKKDVSPD